MTTIVEPQMLLPASVVLHLTECYRELCLMQFNMTGLPESEYERTYRMYDGEMGKAIQKLNAFNRKTLKG